MLYVFTLLIANVDFIVSICLYADKTKMEIPFSFNQFDNVYTVRYIPLSKS